MAFRVLVIEDSDIMLRFLECSLRLRFECVFAASGRKALALFDEALDRGEPFDLVLSDYHLPDGDGLDLAREMRAREAARGLSPCALVMLSSDAVLAETRPQGEEYGISCWLTKPVLPDRLVEVVAELLDRRGGESGPQA